MVDIHHEGHAKAPLAVAFAYIDDFSKIPDWMFGLSTFEPVDKAKDHGLGSVYDGVFSVKPVKLTSRVEVTQWEQDTVIALTSIKGFTNNSVWRFSADGPEACKISVKFTYELPGGLAGRALGKALEPIVALSIRQSDAALTKGIEASYAAQKKT